MMRRRNNFGPVLAVDEVDDGDLQSFLQRFDITKEFVLPVFHHLATLKSCPFSQDVGSITNLDVNDLLSESQLQTSALILTPSSVLEKNDIRRATKSQGRVEDFTKSPSPSLSRQTVAPPMKIKSPGIQETMETSSAKTRSTKSMDIDDDRDELDLIGSPLSHSEVCLIGPFHQNMTSFKKKHRTTTLAGRQLV